MRRVAFSLACLGVLWLCVSGRSYADESPGQKPNSPTSTGPPSAPGQRAPDASHGDEAEAAFRKSLQRNPRDVAALKGLAEARMKRGDFQGAYPLLQRALALAPGDASVQALWGGFMAAVGQPAEAETAYKKALQLKPKEIEWRLDLGSFYLNQRQVDRAVETFKAALELDPKNPRAHMMLAVALAQRQNFDQSQSQLDEAIKLDPKNPEWYEALATFHARRGQAAAALDALGQALAADPKYLQAYWERAEIFVSLGQKDKALYECEAATQAAPDSALAFAHLGQGQRTLNHIPEAEQAYRKSISLDPKLVMGYNNLAFLCAEKKIHLDEALVLAQKAAQLDSGSVEIQDTLGWVYRARGELDKALEVLQKASEVEPQQPRVLYHLGVVYADKGDVSNAFSALNEALSLGSNFEGADDARARSYDLSRQLAK